MSSKWLKMVPIATSIGTMNSSSSSSVITSTAKLRRPPSRAWNHCSIGQVATTIIVAQIVEPMKGRRIHSEATMSKPIKSTPSVVRTRSGACFVMGRVSTFSENREGSSVGR